MGSGITKQPNINDAPNSSMRKQSTALSLKDKNTPGSILLLGLSSCGKTTICMILQRFEDGKEINEYVPQPPPTTAPCSRICHIGERVFEVKDCPGNHRLRTSWFCDLANIQAVVFAVDGYDRLRLPLCLNEIVRALGAPELKPLPFMILLTKQDLAGAITPTIFEGHFESFLAQNTIAKCGSKPYSTDRFCIKGCSAATPESVHTAMSWVLNET